MNDRRSFCDLLDGAGFFAIVAIFALPIYGMLAFTLIHGLLVLIGVCQ